MKAHVGDMIEVRGRHVDDVPRRGQVLEVRGPDGRPPYVMQWDDSPHVSIYYPGSDAHVCHLENEQQAS